MTKINIILKLLSLINILLLSLFSEAYESITCQSDSLSDCLAELSELVGIEPIDSCDLKELNFEEGSVSQDEFYILTCHDLNFFIKKQTVSKNQEHSRIQDFLSNETSSDVVLPVAELRVLSPESAYYTIFPYIDGKTLSTVKEEMFEKDLDRSRLNEIYSSVGSALGDLHKTGLFNTGTNFLSLKSQLVHGDLHDSNIIIKPDDSVLFIDIDGLSNSIESPQHLTKDIQSVTLQVLPGPILFLNDPLIADWLDAIPGFVKKFADSYCSALSIIETSHCSSQIKDHITIFLRSTYHDLVDSNDSDITSDESDESESTTYVNSDELENRLGNLLSNCP